jgi:prepilin-type N-terminal cleavage/methylation domain-containing protein
VRSAAHRRRRQRIGALRLPRAGHHRPGRRPAAGFTLVETLVAMLVAAVALAIAAGLLREAAWAMAGAVRETRSPLASVAADTLRRDLQSCRGAAPHPLAPVGGAYWVRDPLILLGHPAGAVGYALDDDRLVRQVMPTDGGPPRRRDLLRGVSEWGWRRPAPDLLEVRVVFMPPAAAGADRLRRPFTGTLAGAAGARVIRLQVSPRAGGGGSGW